MIHTHKTRPAIPQPAPKFNDTPPRETRFSAEELERAMGPKIEKPPVRTANQ